MLAFTRLTFLFVLNLQKTLRIILIEKQETDDLKNGSNVLKSAEELLKQQKVEYHFGISIAT